VQKKLKSKLPISKTKENILEETGRKYALQYTSYSCANVRKFFIFTLCQIHFYHVV